MESGSGDARSPPLRREVFFRFPLFHICGKEVPGNRFVVSKGRRPAIFWGSTTLNPKIADRSSSEKAGTLRAALPLSFLTRFIPTGQPRGEEG